MKQGNFEKLLVAQMIKKLVAFDGILKVHYCEENCNAM
jgi:hypothetical protein